MMGKTQELGNQPAYPFESVNYPNLARPGMTHRQWLAGKAMQGMLANSALDPSPEGAAEWAYKHADAMLAFEQAEQEDGAVLAKDST